MPLGRPTKPARIRGTNDTMTITTQEWSTDSMGQSFPQAVSTKSGIPVRRDTVSPAEAQRYGHAVNDTVFRLRCPVRHPDGSSIVLKHNQFVTIDSVQYQVNGDGKPEGRSGWQTVIVKQRGK